MLIIPAIDLLDGKVVRLYKGKRENCKIYDNNPIRIVKRWRKYGVKLIHVVDLNAAFACGDNLNVISKILKEGIEVQIGGGIRTTEKAEKLIKLGAKRIVIGSKIIDKEFLSTITKRFSAKIAASIDVLRGKFMVSGWQSSSGYSAKEIIAYVIKQKIKWIIYTDISRDGTLKGINLNTIKQLAKYKNVNFIISGGINSINDIIAIKKHTPFIKGIIIGKAIYENRIDLKDALSLI